MMKQKSILALNGGSKVRNKPFRSHPVMGREEKKEVLSVLKTGLLSGFVAKPGTHFYGGPKVLELERLFCEYFGASHAVAMNSATSALHAALLAVGVEPGDEVIVSPYTMSASASAIVMCGGIPVFVDIEPEHFCINPEKIREKITNKTKAILVVHLFGHPAQMQPILKIASERKLKIIEDCAQSPGAQYNGRYVGAIGDIGVFSLNQHKTITTGEGGVAVTSNATLALRMQLVRNHGEVVVDHLEDAKNIPCLGWNYRMTELEASVGIAQIKKLDQLTKHRVGLAELLTQKLKAFPALKLPKPSKNSTHVYFTYPIGFDETKTKISRDLFVKALIAEGIPVGAGYVRPIYFEPMYQNKKIFEKSHFPFDLQKTKNINNYHKGSCPNAEFFYEKGLLMTGLCRYPLTRADMEDIFKAVKKIFDNISKLQLNANS